MSRLPCNNRGFTLVEVLFALFLTIVAVLGTLALISPAWKTAEQTDYLGRAAGILYERLMMEEAMILNPCNAVPVSNGPTAVFASGQATAQPGDAQFTVTTTIALIGTNVWSVNVLVAWPGQAGISETLVVTRQEGFRFPAGCASL